MHTVHYSVCVQCSFGIRKKFKKKWKKHELTLTYCKNFNLKMKKERNPENVKLKWNYIMKEIHSFFFFSAFASYSCANNEKKKKKKDHEISSTWIKCITKISDVNETINNNNRHHFRTHCPTFTFSIVRSYKVNNIHAIYTQPVSRDNERDFESMENSSMKKRLRWFIIWCLFIVVKVNVYDYWMNFVFENYDW